MLHCLDEECMSSASVYQLPGLHPSYCVCSGQLGRKKLEAMKIEDV